MTVCPTCNGELEDIRIACPEGRIRCLVRHFGIVCRDCGTTPDTFFKDERLRQWLTEELPKEAAIAHMEPLAYERMLCDLATNAGGSFWKVLLP